MLDQRLALNPLFFYLIGHKSIVLYYCYFYKLLYILVKTFFRDHNNPMSKTVENFNIDFLFENTLHIWKYFILKIWTDSFCPHSPTPQTVLLLLSCLYVGIVCSLNT